MTDAEPLADIGNCTCDKQCDGPDVSDCTCIYTVHDHTCRCDCIHPGPPTHKKASLDLYSEIAIDMGSNVTVARFGAFLASISDLKLLIPAERANDKISIKDRDTTVGDVIERAGLIVANDNSAAH